MVRNYQAAQLAPTVQERAGVLSQEMGFQCESPAFLPGSHLGGEGPVGQGLGTVSAVLSTAPSTHQPGGLGLVPSVLCS